MGLKLGLNGQAGVFPLSNRFVEMGGIPVDDDGSKKVESGHAVVLAMLHLSVIRLSRQARSCP